jgi:hypothetical protein
VSLVPDTKPGKIAFYKSRLALWTTNSVAIGSSAAEISALSALITAAETSLLEQEQARETSESKTLACDNAIAAMEYAGATVISGVRYKARTAGDVVFELSNLPAPATPSPVAPPGKPTDFTAELQEDGSVILGWKCPNPVGVGGTSYQVYRRDTPEGEFEAKGVAGERKWIDATIPAGSSQVTYKIRAFRSTAAGPWALYTVTFGTGGTTSVADASGPKIAA